MFVPLSELARASLGYKSLQNDFFYVSKATIDTYGIEADFLKPIFMLRDLKATRFEQEPTSRIWLFYCQSEERDLRGTGAYRYIQTMSERGAAQRKQSGNPQTIRQALLQQGGNLWYAPKAIAHQHKLWLRKAFDGIYSPFVFKKPAVVDQRCNSIAVVKGLPEQSLAAAITSTLFGYALEVNGSASLGAGALEAGTTRLRTFPVFDIRQLNNEEHKTLQELAHRVWKHEKPLSWTTSPEPGEHLRALDSWLLKRAKNPISLETLYRDLASVCADRITVARDKTKTSKKIRSESISSVAKSIAESIRKLLESRRFPEDFTRLLPAAEMISISAPRDLIRRIELHPFMQTAELLLFGSDTQPLFQAELDRPVAEAVIRALLSGRGSFSIPNDHKAARTAVDEYLSWFSSIEKRLQDGIADSALGTGYEDQLTTEVFKILGLNPLVTEKDLPLHIDLA